MIASSDVRLNESVVCNITRGCITWFIVCLYLLSYLLLILIVAEGCGIAREGWLHKMVQKIALVWSYLPEIGTKCSHTFLVGRQQLDSSMPEHSWCVTVSQGSSAILLNFFDFFLASGSQNHIKNMILSPVASFSQSRINTVKSMCLLKFK